MLSMTVGKSLNVPQEIQDEIDLLLVAATLSGYEVNKRQVSDGHSVNINFPCIVYYLKKDNKIWHLSLNYHSKGEVLYIVSFRKEKSNFNISSADLNDDLIKPIKIAKMIL